MFLGGLSGALVAHLVTLSGLAVLDPALFAVVGIASSLTAVVGVPIAAMALVFEVFGKAYGPPTILACGLTFIATIRFRHWAQVGGAEEVRANVERLVGRFTFRGPSRKWFDIQSTGPYCRWHGCHRRLQPVAHHGAAGAG